MGKIGCIGLAMRAETSDSLSVRKAREWTRRRACFGRSNIRRRRPSGKLTTGFYHRPQVR